MTNFMREVHCILGLPFDAMSMSDALNYVRDAAKHKKSCIVATPNLNFIVACRKDNEFRKSIVTIQRNLSRSANFGRHRIKSGNLPLKSSVNASLADMLFFRHVDK